VQEPSSAPAGAPPASANGIADDFDSSAEDIVGGDTGNDIADQVYPESRKGCSCDCCQVEKMLETDFVRKPNGDVITSKCWKATADVNSDEEANQESLCPSKCQASEDNTILSAAKGELDYNRYCNYNCQPVTDAVGTSCVQFPKSLFDEAKKGDGNGVEVWPEPVLGVNSGFASRQQPAATADKGEAKPAEAKKEAQEAEASPTEATEEAATATKETAAKSSAPPVDVVYDMRKLIAERMRSEAGANMAAAAAAAERVRINNWSTKRNFEDLKKFRVKYAAIGGKVEADVAGVEADKAEADEAEIMTQKNLAEGRIFATKMVKDVRKLAEEAIKKEVTPCVAQAAKSRAEAKGLDKPKDWFKVVAARAANPYQKAVTTAVQRTAEYKGLADGLMDQAYAAQKQANTLITHVNVLQAQGDVIGATIEKKQVTNLLSRARALSAEAAGYWNTAQKTRETIPKWQMAAAQAAAYASWEYKNNALAFR
jgi:hypothetical protein